VLATKKSEERRDINKAKQDYLKKLIA